MEPRIDETLRIPALDGFELAATLYEPGAGAGDGGPAVLINSATAVRRGYYDGYARYLTDRGFTVLTYDYRGIGGSRPRRLSGFQASMRQWGEQDLAGVLDWVAGHLRPQRLLVVGHSVGGQIAGLAENNHRIHALVTVGSQNGWWRHWPVPARYKIALTWWVSIPLVTRVYGYLPGRFGTKEDLPAGVAREWARWGRRRSHLLESDEQRAGFARLRGPLLAYSFTDDDYAPRPAVEALLDLYSEADIYHHHLAPRDVGAEAVGHFGFFRDRFQDTLWQDSVAWLEQQATPAAVTSLHEAHRSSRAGASRVGLRRLQ